MLKVNEIFASIEGETTASGWPCTFVRLAGCNLRCTWCDTIYAWESGYEKSVDDIVAEVVDKGLKRVLVTGGEPLIQEEAFQLISVLADAGMQVYVETNGTVDISRVDERAHIRLDLKPPSSGMTEEILWGNIPRLSGKDEVKIVIAGPEDYAWATDTIKNHDLTNICPVNLTPELSSIQPHLLARWIIGDKLDVRLNLQMHKIIWGESARGV